MGLSRVNLDGGNSSMVDMADVLWIGVTIIMIKVSNEIVFNE